MKVKLALAALLLVGACTLPPPFGASPALSFPQDLDDGGIRYVPGGPFLVTMTVDAGGKVVTSARGFIEIVSAEASASATNSSVLTLQRQDNGDLSGTTALSWPDGGPVLVRGTFGGKEVFEVARLDPLRIGIAPFDSDAGERSGVSVAYRACVECTAVGGSVAVNLTNATTAGGASAVTLSLLDGGCTPALFPSAPQLTHVQTKIVTNSSAFSVGATLVGTSAFAQQDGVASPLRDLKLDLNPVPSYLPPAGSVVAVTVTATSDGDRVPGVAVAFETLPSTSILPPTVVTDSNGTGSVSVLVPEGAVDLRIDAVSGQVRTGLTLAPDAG